MTRKQIENYNKMINLIINRLFTKYFFISYHWVSLTGNGFGNITVSGRNLPSKTWIKNFINAYHKEDVNFVILSITKMSYKDYINYEQNKNS